MKIKVREIPSEGLELSQNIEPTVIGLSDPEYQYLSPLRVKGTVKKIEDTVVATVAVAAKLAFTCSRCLESFEQDRSKEFCFDYAVDQTVEAIDLGEDIRQEMILELPVRILCKEDCRGICAKCGANLNKEECKCKK